MSRTSMCPNRRALLTAALATPLPGRRALASPLTITDALGRPITLNAPAERIVLGFNFEEYTAIAGPEGWDRVVGLAKTLLSGWRPSIYKRYIVPIPLVVTLPDVGNTDDNTFSLERVLSLRPDLVIMAEWSFSNLTEQVKQIEALGIPVMVIDYNTEIPERHVASTIAMGIATGNEERGRALAKLYTGKLAEIRNRLPDAGVKAKVYVELGQGGAGQIGNTYWGAMWGRLIEFTGADNIAANHIPAAWGPLNPEYVLAADPDAIFIAGSSWANSPTREGRASGQPAAQNGRPASTLFAGVLARQGPVRSRSSRRHLSSTNKRIRPMKTLALGVVLLASLGGGAYAQTSTISVEKAWARPTVPAVKTGVVYVTILDHGAPDRLIAASTPVAGMAELHETVKDGNVMKMRAIDGLAIPQNQPVAFAPGGYHIMLTNLKQPLAAGEHFPLSLKFQNAGVVETTVTVQGSAAAAMTMGNGAHEMPMGMPMKTPTNTPMSMPMNAPMTAPAATKP